MQNVSSLSVKHVKCDVASAFHFYRAIVDLLYSCVSERVMFVGLPLFDLGIRKMVKNRLNMLEIFKLFLIFCNLVEKKDKFFRR